MSLDKAIEHGKEKRKPYYGAQAIDCTCRPHGSCEWCRSNRMYQQLKMEEASRQALEESEEEECKYILTEHELNRGCELIEAWQTEDMTLDCAYIEQTNLNEQGYFTVINCTDVEKDWYRITVFRRNK